MSKLEEAILDLLSGAAYIYWCEGTDPEKREAAGDYLDWYDQLELDWFLIVTD